MRHNSSAVRPVGDFSTPSGSRIHRILEPRFNGVTTSLVEVGTEDIQDKINALGPFCDLNYMLHRLSLGDSSVVAPKEPLYGDFSGLPRDPIEAVNLVHQSEQAFTRLSPEDKQKYNNDWRRWFADLLTPKVSKPVSSEPAQEVIKEVVDNG